MVMGKWSLLKESSTVSQVISVARHGEHIDKSMHDSVPVCTCICVSRPVFIIMISLVMSRFSIFLPCGLVRESPHTSLRALKSPTSRKGGGNCRRRLWSCSVVNSSVGVI